MVSKVKGEVLDFLGRFSKDPVKFVEAVFPWQKKGTDLEKHSGPRQWQRTILEHIRDGLMTVDEAVQVAVASGHGIGKSCLVAWIILWAISTREHTKGVVTANTETQLKTKTWPELAKWHRLFLAKELFKLTATGLFAADPKHEKEWRIDMVPWSESNTEAFAGLHNEGKRVIVIYDEASAIPDTIWEVSEGALTDENTEIIWCCFGNPTLNTGRFRQCFSKFRHRWHRHQIDSRTVPGTNKKQFKKWEEDYDEDSDFFRVRVRGVFPRAGSNQFISSELAEKASEREVITDRGAALTLGVDIARFGDDQTIMRMRCGRDARTYPVIKLRGADTMEVTGHIIQLIRKWKPDAVFVDTTGGLGAGPVDRLKELGYDYVQGANSSRRASDKKMWPNKRCEMWGRMKQWLEDGCIDGDSDLSDDLIGPTYKPNSAGQIALEKKEDMKSRGLQSPDNADALALTFYEHILRRDVQEYVSRAKTSQTVTEYNEFEVDHV